MNSSMEVVYPQDSFRTSWTLTTFQGDPSPSSPSINHSSREPPFMKCCWESLSAFMSFNTVAV
ncbi:mCG148237 [Mus musculus]|nr:mCG148237 [Mus musculus]